MNGWVLLAAVTASVLGVLLGVLLARVERRHRDALRVFYLREWVDTHPPTDAGWVVDRVTDGDTLPHARSDDFSRWVGEWTNLPRDTSPTPDGERCPTCGSAGAPRLVRSAAGPSWRWLECVDVWHTQHWRCAVCDEPWPCPSSRLPYPHGVPSSHYPIAYSSDELLRGTVERYTRPTPDEVNRLADEGWEGEWR